MVRIATFSSALQVLQVLLLRDEFGILPIEKNKREIVQREVDREVLQFIEVTKDLLHRDDFILFLCDRRLRNECIPILIVFLGHSNCISRNNFNILHYLLLKSMQL